MIGFIHAGVGLRIYFGSVLMVPCRTIYGIPLRKLKHQGSCRLHRASGFPDDHIASAEYSVRLRFSDSSQQVPVIRTDRHIMKIGKKSEPQSTPPQPAFTFIQLILLYGKFFHTLKYTIFFMQTQQPDS